MGTNGGCRCIDKIEDALSRRSTVTPPDVECGHRWRVLLGGIRCDHCGKQIAAYDDRSTVTPERREYDFNVVRVYCLRHPRTAMTYDGTGFLCGECNAAVTIFGPSIPTVTPEGTCCVEAGRVYFSYVGKHGAEGITIACDHPPSIPTDEGTAREKS
jgi:hypothetical protein